MAHPKTRLGVQLLSFAVFLTLMIIGKAQFWMALIFASIILASYFGRFYCGWICPINTLIRPINWLGRMLATQKKSVPSWISKTLVRRIVLSLFLGGLGYTIYTITQGRKFPLPAIIIPLGLLVTLFVNETAWHRYLCPWGILFSLTGRFAKLKISAQGCRSCNVCTAACPAGAINVGRTEGARIDPTYCLVCFQCQEVCPVNALNYGRPSVKDVHDAPPVKGL